MTSLAHYVWMGHLVRLSLSSRHAWLFIISRVCVWVCVRVYTFLHSHSFSLNPQFVLVFICLPHSCATAYSWPSLFFFFLLFCFCLVAFALPPSLSFQHFHLLLPDPHFVCQTVAFVKFSSVAFSVIIEATFPPDAAVTRNFSASSCAVVSLRCFGGRWQSCLPPSPQSSPHHEHVTVAISDLVFVVLFGVGKNLGYMYIFLPGPKRTIK